LCVVEHLFFRVASSNRPNRLPAAKNLRTAADRMLEQVYKNTVSWSSPSIGCASTSGIKSAGFSA
jgi:hypothetical protein